MNRVVPNLKK